MSQQEAPTITATAGGKTATCAVTVTSSSSTSGVSITSVSTTSSSKVGLTDDGADTTDAIANNTFNNTVTIVFSGTSATINNTVSGVTATASNGTVTINSTATGVNYQVSGTTTNGSLNITSSNQFKLTLSGANITNTSGAAINIASNVKAFVVLPSGTTSTLSDSSSNTTDATFLSAGSLLFSGAGTLSVAAKKNDAIQATSKMRLTDATISITEAVNDGIQAGTLFVMNSGTLNITTSPTASYSKGVSVLTGYLIVNDGTITINTSASAGMANQYVSSSQANTDAYSTIINGGTINITSNSSTAEVEGIESNHGTVNINGGTLTLNVTDDAINAESSVNINGGKIYAYVTGNDGVDSNGTMYITGGILVAVSTAASPETSIDSDSNTFNISGGIVVGITPGANPTSPSASTQPVVLLGSGSANQIINIQSSSKEIITFLAPAIYANILISTPNLSKSTSYTVYKGGSVSNGENFNGLYTSGTYSGGTQYKTFSTGSSSYTQSK